MPSFRPFSTIHELIGYAVAEEIESLLEEIKSHRAELRESGLWWSFKTEDAEELLLISSTINSLLYSLTKISSAISEINKNKHASNSLSLAQEA